MAWNGGGFGDEEEGSGLELSLGLPGYFSRPYDKPAGACGVCPPSLTASFLVQE
jgi:hypothetical protein